MNATGHRSAAAGVTCKGGAQRTGRLLNVELDSQCCLGRTNPEPMLINSESQAKSFTRWMIIVPIGVLGFGTTTAIIDAVRDRASDAESALLVAYGVLWVVYIAGMAKLYLHAIDSDEQAVVSWFLILGRVSSRAASAVVCPCA